MIFCVCKGVISRMRTLIKILFWTLSLEMILKTFCMQLYIFLSSHCGDMNPGHVFACVSEFESLMHCRSGRCCHQHRRSFSPTMHFVACPALYRFPSVPPSSALLAFPFLSLPWPSSPLTHLSPFQHSSTQRRTPTQLAQR